MAFFCSSHCLLLVLLVQSCLLVPSFSLSKEDGPFNSIYSFGDSDSSSSAPDQIAATLSLPSPQPYTQQDTEYFESGLSFAIPCATIMPFFFLKNAIPPPPQSHDLSPIVTFMKFFYKDCNLFHDCGRNKVLQKALIFMDQLGINDYKQAFLHGKSICEVSHLVPADFLVFGLCEGDPIRKNRICHRGLNMFSKLHNDHLYLGPAIEIP